jgi:hypothetical protein
MQLCGDCCFSQDQYRSAIEAKQSTISKPAEIIVYDMVPEKKGKQVYKTVFIADKKYKMYGG